MARKTTRVEGDGITRVKREVLEIELDCREDVAILLDSIRAAGKRANARAADPWGHDTRRWTASARRVLDAGPMAGEDRFDEPRTGRGWYAREILRIDSLVKELIAAGDAAGAAVEAGLFGWTVKEAETKFSLEDYALRGEKSQRGNARGGELSRKHSKECYIATWQKYYSALGKKKVSDEEAAEELKVSPSTIRNARRGLTKGAGSSD